MIIKIFIKFKKTTEFKTPYFSNFFYIADLDIAVKFLKLILNFSLFLILIDQTSITSSLIF